MFNLTAITNIFKRQSKTNVMELFYDLEALDGYCTFNYVEKDGVYTVTVIADEHINVVINSKKNTARAYLNVANGKLLYRGKQVFVELPATYNDIVYCLFRDPSFLEPLCVN